MSTGIQSTDDRFLSRWFLALCWLVWGINGVASVLSLLTSDWIPFVLNTGFWATTSWVIVKILRERRRRRAITEEDARINAMFDAITEAEAKRGSENHG